MAVEALVDLITLNDRKVIGIGTTMRRGFIQCKGISNLGTRWTLAHPVEVRVSHTRMTLVTTARSNEHLQFNRSRNRIWESSMGSMALVEDPNSKVLSYKNSETEMADL